MMAALDPALQLAISKHGLGIVLTIMEGLGNAHAANIESTNHGVFIKMHYAKKPLITSSHAVSGTPSSVITREQFLMRSTLVQKYEHTLANRHKEGEEEASNLDDNAAAVETQMNQEAGPAADARKVEGATKARETKSPKAMMHTEETTLTMKAMKKKAMKAMNAMSAMRATKAKDEVSKEATKRPVEEMSRDNQLLLQAFKDRMG